MLCPPLGSSVHEALYTGDIGEIELRRGSSHLLLSSAFFISVHVQISPPPTSSTQLASASCARLFVLINSDL